MKNLYFIRHGESQANLDQVWGGQIETPLTEKGEAQAIQAGQSAKEAGLNFDLIIASPLSRATDTARLIAKELKFPDDLILIDKLLIERSFGVLDGTPDAPSFFLEHKYKDLDYVENAETVEDLQIRATEGLKKFSSLPEQNILLVGHGAYGRALRRAVNHRPFTDEFDKPWEEQFIPNAQIFKLI